MAGSIGINVQSNIEGTTRYLSRVQHRVVPLATMRGLNKTMANVETKARRSIAKQMGIPQGRVRKGMFKLKARLGKLTTSLTGTGRPINLIRFKARKAKKGVRASPWGRRRLYPNAFIGNNGRTVFIRDPKDRGYMSSRKGRTKHSEQIRPMWGPSIPKTMLEREVQTLMALTAGTRFSTNFYQAMKFLLEKETL